MPTESVNVLIEDLWAALDALDSVQDAKESVWCRRLEKAASEASQLVALDNGWMKQH